MNPEDKQEDELDPAKFEKEFANRAASPGYDQAQAEMDETEQKKESSPEELDQAEHAGASREADSTEAAKSTSGSKAAGWVTEMAAPEVGVVFNAATALKSVFWGSKRRKQATVGAGIAGTLTGGGILMLIFISGPLEIMHLAQTLQKGFSTSQQISDSRGNKLIRYASAQDTGETRLSLLERHYLRGTVSDLEDMGVSFQKNSNSNLNGVDINTANEKLLEKYPELRGMSTDEKKAWIADKLNVPLTDVEGAGDAFSITKDPGAFLSGTKSMLGSVLGTFSDGGALSTAMKARVLSKYFDLPSLFHPISRALAAKAQGAQNAIDAEREIQDEEQAQLTPTETQADVVQSEENIKEGASGLKSGLMKALNITGGMCFAISAGTDITKINQALIEAPSEIEAVNVMALAAQIESGQEVSAPIIDGTLASLTSGNQDVFAGKAMQVLEGVPNPSGGATGNLDISPDYRQAFTVGSSSTATVIGKHARSLLDNVRIKAGPVTIGGANQICSSAGQLAVTIGQLGLDFFATLGDAVSGGTLTPVELAAFAAEQGESFAINAAIFHYLQEFIVNNSTTKGLAKDAFSGAQGGDLLAYGARAAGNVVAASQGGIEMAASAAQAISDNQQNMEKKQFQSESFFARMFDIHDYRSLIGRLATSINPSLRQNLINFASDIGNFGQVISSAFTNLFAAIFPHASAAAATTYDWGFPQIGIPEGILNSTDPSFANPYTNADITASIFNQDSSYISRAEACFGVTISNDSGQWEVTPAGPINEDTPPYTTSNCSNVSDQKWQHVMLFVADNSTMDTMACMSGDNQSCDDLGFPQTSSSSSSDPTANGSLPNGTAQQLAQAILNNPNVGYEFDAQQDMQDAAAGKPGTAGHPISTTLLQLIDELAQHHTFKISALESHGTGHSSSPTDPHYMGFAVDIVNVDGDPTANSGIGRTAGDVSVINELAPLMPRSDSAGLSGFGQSECGTTPPLPAGIVTFTDTCSHLHIQIPEDSP